LLRFHFHIRYGTHESIIVDSVGKTNLYKPCQRTSSVSLLVSHSLPLSLSFSFYRSFAWYDWKTKPKKKIFLFNNHLFRLYLLISTYVALNVSTTESRLSIHTHTHTVLYLLSCICSVYLAMAIFVRCISSPVFAKLPPLEHD